MKEIVVGTAYWICPSDSYSRSQTVGISARLPQQLRFESLRIAFGIAVSAYAEEIGRKQVRNLGTKRVQTCHPISSNSRQRPNDNWEALEMTKKSCERVLGEINLSARTWL